MKSTSIYTSIHANCFNYVQWWHYEFLHVPSTCIIPSSEEFHNRCRSQGREISKAKWGRKGIFSHYTCALQILASVEAQMTYLSMYFLFMVFTPACSRQFLGQNTLSGCAQIFFVTHTVTITSHLLSVLCAGNYPCVCTIMETGQLPPRQEVRHQSPHFGLGLMTWNLMAGFYPFLTNVTILNF